MHNFNDEKIYNKYLKIFLILLLLGSIPLFFSYLFVLRAWENTPFETIVKYQNEHNAIYGTALNPNDLAYKIQLVHFRQPHIIALGSSRVMQLRENFFEGKFTNCGGIFSSLYEGQAFVDQMLALHKPQIVFWGLDYWWFNKKYIADETRRFVDEKTINKEKLLKPIQWLIEKKISIHDFFTVIVSGRTHNPYTNFDNLGIHAIKISNGFRKDGSYIDIEYAFGINKNRLEKINEEQKSIIDDANERASSAGNSFVDTERWSIFLAILNKFKANNIPVVLFLPPIAPSIYRVMKDKTLIDDLRHHISELHEEFYDFSDGASLGSDDKEFLDAWHSGEVVYLRLLRSIQMREKKSKLAFYLATNLDQYINFNQNKVAVIYPEDAPLFLLRE